MAKISVIIPVYNVEKFLRRCIDSVLNQTLKDIEIVCVNDGSTDNSGLILEEYKKYENIKIINQKNSGISVSRNVGIENSTGEFVAFLDSDDFVDEDYYEKLYKNLVEYNADIACSSIVRMNEKKVSELIKYDNVEVSRETRDKFLLAQSPKYNFVCNKLFRKEVIVKNNLKFIPGMVYEDMCFFPDIIELSERLVTVPDTRYYYWKHKYSLIKGSCDKNRADKLQAHQYLLKKCRKYNVDQKQKEELQYKKQYKILGILFLKEYSYRATKKYYLFGLIPFLEVVKGI